MSTSSWTIEMVKLVDTDGRPGHNISCDIHIELSKVLWDGSQTDAYWNIIEMQSSPLN